jgi:multicomponent Na+:H+ antiporter subunit A
MAAILVLHAVLGFGLLVVRASTWGRRMGRTALVVGGIAPVAALIWWATAVPTVLDGGVVTQTWTWVDQLGLAIDLRLDGFAALMVAIISGIGVLVYAYAWSYFEDDTPGLGRLAGLLTLFSGAMLGVVLADNLVVLYGFWELTSITSFLLIGNQYRVAAARAAALQAILVTGAGGLAMLLGFVMLGQAAGTYQLSAILADPPAGAVVTAALVLILMGAFTKSAQYPFHSWLPGAMVAPTPVSAYLHSATMVKAGVYLIARLAPVFAVLATGWRPLVLTVGAVTMVAGALRALRQHDLKLLLAFGTVSQLGFMVVLFGIGTPEATAAGCAVILAHALFKAALFMVVGIVDHGTGTRDIRRLPPLGGGWRATKAVAVVVAASMAGVPLMFGFVAKELGFQALVDGGFDASIVTTIAVVTGSMLTAAYGARFVGGLFGRWSAEAPVSVEATSAGVPAADRIVSAHAPGWVFVLPSALLAVATVVAGVLPGLLDGVVGAAASSLDGAAADLHLAVWHSVNLALVLSGVALAGGALLYLGSSAVAPVLAVGSRVPSGTQAYRSFLKGIDVAADRITGVVQSGSMPVYLGIVLTTVAVLPGVALLGTDVWPDWPEWVDTPIQLPIVAVLLGAALGAAVVRHRLSAALLLGVVGYSMAALFVVQGAPDLALTQAGVETLTTVLFVLALRRLPSRFERSSIPITKAIRLTIAVAVGVMVFGFALVASGDVLPRDVSEEMIERAVPDGDGANVVNVILVDFRGLDTLGEITVVAVASIGAVALARAGRRPRPAPAASATGPGGTSRHAFVDVVVRVLVYVAFVVSVYLLVVGHNQPGGGFVGGLVAGAAVALRYVAGGLDEVRRLVRVRPWTILGSGVLVSVLTAAAPVVFGDAILENAKLEVDLALLGELGVSSALAFDLGVYLVVLGLVLMVFEAFGGDDRDAVPDAFTPTEPDPGPGRDPDPAPDLAAAPDDALDADAPDDALDSDALDSDALEEEVLT